MGSEQAPELLLRLETERLVLRDFTEEDWPEVLEYQRQPEYLRFYPWESRDEDDVRGYIALFLGWQREIPRHRFQLAITLADTGAIIGNVGVRAEVPGALSADLGFELDARYWGRGYATEAAAAMLEFGFEQLDLHRLVAHCIADNTASARVLERIGMRQEGRLRQSEYFKDRWWDVLLFGMLSSDRA
ncbi:MAG: GNAT family N-acetyltransferase [Gemmatimonadota bacterium]